MDYTDLAYFVEPMRARDIREVGAIERLSFPTPWPTGAYYFELRRNPSACYFVARPQGPVPPLEEPPRGLLARLRPPKGTPPVMGYGGFWRAGREAHISTIAVHPSLRRRGIGQLLLATMIEKAVSLGAYHVTLEVRASNQKAQSLYRKFGFRVTGRKRMYYTDSGEDAVLMTLEDVASPAYQEEFRSLCERLRERLRLKDDAEDGHGHEQLD